MKVTRVVIIRAFAMLRFAQAEKNVHLIAHKPRLRLKVFPFPQTFSLFTHKCFNRLVRSPVTYFLQCACTTSIGLSSRTPLINSHQKLLTIMPHDIILTISNSYTRYKTLRSHILRHVYSTFSYGLASVDL